MDDWLDMDADIKYCFPSISKSKCIAMKLSEYFRNFIEPQIPIFLSKRN